MKKCLINLCRCISCAPFKFGNMWWKSTVINSVNRLSALSRSRKIILALFVLLVFLYYIVPKLFGSRVKTHYRSSGSCLESKLAEYQNQIDSFNAVTNFVDVLEPGQKNYPIYVGNGHLAASYGSRNGLYIRLNRALSLPVPYYPVVDVGIDNILKEEVDVLELKHGLANRLQVFNTVRGCVYAESQMYAHRSHPTLLVQEISLHNPTGSNVIVDFDQVTMATTGWKDAQSTVHSETNTAGMSVQYTVTSGVVRASPTEDQYVGVAVATTSIREKQEHLAPNKYSKQHILTTVQYTKAMSLEAVKTQLVDVAKLCTEEMTTMIKSDMEVLKMQHISLWEMIWESGCGISYSRAADALNGDKINSTMYYVLSNVPAPLHAPKTSSEVVLALKKTLHYPDMCYNEHTTLHSTTLWVDGEDEDSIARIVTTWIITLEKQGCKHMILAGVEGVLQAMILSIGALHFGNDHLAMNLHPKDTHRDFYFHRINYGNNTHLNISVLVGEDNRASIFVSLDRNDRPYYACDAGCLDPPRPLSKKLLQLPVKLTEPYTAILYITADDTHMSEYKHAIHVHEIAEAPAHEHHVIALHRHGHHFGGLPTIFWVSITFLITVFHLFLFKLIYNEYCQASDRFTKSKYGV